MELSDLGWVVRGNVWGIPGGIGGGGEVRLDPVRYRSPNRKTQGLERELVDGVIELKTIMDIDYAVVVRSTSLRLSTTWHGFLRELVLKV